MYSNTLDTAPDSSSKAAEAPWRLFTKTNPESGTAPEAASDVCVELRTGFFRKSLTANPPMEGIVLVKSKTNVKMKMNSGHRKRLKAGA